jgi:hypothetical protein
VSGAMEQGSSAFIHKVKIKRVYINQPALKMEGDLSLLLFDTLCPHHSFSSSQAFLPTPSLIKKKVKFSSYIRILIVIGCKVIYD